MGRSKSFPSSSLFIDGGAFHDAFSFLKLIAGGNKDADSIQKTQLANIWLFSNGHEKVRISQICNSSMLEKQTVKCICQLRLRILRVFDANLRKY